MKELISKNIGRPMRILFGEPIVLLVSFYVSYNPSYFEVCN